MFGLPSWLIAIFIIGGIGYLVLILFLGFHSKENQRERDAKNNYKVDRKEIDYDYLDDLKFHKDTNKLAFKVRHYHRQPKITRYVTVDYEKKPIYEAYSERTRVIKVFNRIIHPVKFVNEEILKLSYLTSDMRDKIIDEIKVMPKWREKEQKIKNLTKKIEDEETILLSLKGFYNEEKVNYQYKSVALKEQGSHFWWRLFFVPFTLGLSFIGFVSKKQTKINQTINHDNKKWNAKHQEEIDHKNKLLKKEIKECKNKHLKNIGLLKNSREAWEAKKIVLVEHDQKGWINLRDATMFENHKLKLKNKQGVYIIQNKTKDKYYVGQSQNLYRRIFQQHFKHADVNDHKFAHDWYAEDEFFYKYFLCPTKDEQNILKNKYIARYNAFTDGYNKRGGTK